jgi:rubrerythrin
MYPAYQAVAGLEKEKAAEVSFTWVESEKMHLGLYQKAKQAVDQGRDADLGPLQVCDVCGYMLEGEAPERCPVCRATKDRFRTF